MRAINCCKTMEMELAAWKATIYDIVRKMDKMPGGVKEKAEDLMFFIHHAIPEFFEQSKCTEIRV